MSNEHIFEYLDYYVGLDDPPQYAVMLTGPWGAGKSYSIKRYLEKLRNSEKTVAYVSLYGVKSTDDIALSMLSSLIPMRDNPVSRLGGQVARVLWKHLPDAATGLAAGLVPKFCDLLVLDDLERAAISPIEVFGFINDFIEHESRRVLIVANEAEIDDEPNYRRLREKVIGATFEFKQEIGTALPHFIASIGDEGAQEFLDASQESILQIHHQSGSSNLRILKQSLQSWARIHKVVDPALRENKRGLTEAFKLFLALSIEIRSGRLGRDDLMDRVNKYVVGHMQKREGEGKRGTPLSEADERYSFIRLHNSILSDAVLEQLLCDGRLNASLINESLAANELFRDSGQEPAWRKVWHGYLREAAEFEPAFEMMEKEFTERKFDDPDVILHVFGLRLWGVELGELRKSDAEIVAEGKAYIDDLRELGRLRRYRTDISHRGAHGLAFHHEKTVAFKKFEEYLVEQSEAAYQDRWAAIGDGLLADMSGDAEDFVGRVCWIGGTIKPDCADDAVLSKTLPSAFVDRLIACSPQGQRNVLLGLKKRYETRGLEQNLKAEKPWLMEVDRELRRRLAGLPRIRQYSLSHDFADYLGPLLISLDDQ